jgi:hypothetical protein
MILIKKILIALAIVVAIPGCNFGNSVMISKGEAGFLQSIFGAGGQYCKLTSSDQAHEYTETEIAAWSKYCAGVEGRILDELTER